MHHSSTPPLHYSNLLRLPTTAQCAVELHHATELCSARTGQQQLLVEELLISDQNFQIVREAGVVALAREAGGVCESLNARLQLSTHALELFDCHKRVGHLAET